MEHTLSLVEILRGKPTDKVANGLAEFYDELFGDIRNDVRKILEIGIDKGGSIQGWREFFPHALVYAVDRRAEAITNIAINDHNTVAICCDVTDRQSMEHLLGYFDFDIIIDDGSHINKDVILAFDILWPRLRTGGYYIVEDIQVPYRNPDYPTIGAYFINFALENNIREAEFRSNVLYLRKP